MTDHERALQLKEQELQLILALDKVRDTLEDDGDPAEMFRGIATLLKDRFNADACAIMLVSETSDEVEHCINLGIDRKIGIERCQQAMKLTAPGSLPNNGNGYSLGLRIILNPHSYPLGGIYIARKGEPFSDEEKRLLVQAEDQIDSAVVQARMVWKLTQRNRELEAIYEIDRLRDKTSIESELITGFAQLLLKRFKASLCLVMLTQPENNNLQIREIIDRNNLPQKSLDSIRYSARDIQIPQVIPTPPGAEDIRLLASPFVIGGERFGAVVVGRAEEFTIADHRLLYAMTSQMDSAIVQSRLYQEVDSRNRELETIYYIDHVRDTELDFDNMLQRVMERLCSVIKTEIGFIMLYDQSDEEKLELRASTASGPFNATDHYGIIHQFSRQALDVGKLVFSNEPDGKLKSIAAVPLILNDRVIGVFGAVNSLRPGGFLENDLRILNAIASQVDTAVFERMERRRMRTLLSRSVDPKVLERLLEQADAALLSGERVELSVIFADLRGSTSWAERTPPERLVEKLNQYLERMTNVIFKHGGTLDKFIGDEVIGLFGTPLRMSNHAEAAVRAALEMQAEHQKLQKELEAEGMEIPPMGVGISTGEAIAGEFGPPIRTDFTAMGRIMNLGSRLCSAAAGGQILLAEGTYESVKHVAKLKEIEPIALKGIGETVTVYELLGILDTRADA